MEIKDLTLFYQRDYRNYPTFSGRLHIGRRPSVEESLSTACSADS